MGFLLAKIVVLLLAAAWLGAWLDRWWVRRRSEDVTADYERLVHERLDWRRSFEEKLAARPAIDWSPINARFHALHERLDGLDFVLRSIRIPEPEPIDLTPALERIADLERSVRAIQIPAPREVDLAPVLERLRALEPRPPIVPVSLSVTHIRTGSRNLLAHAAYGKPDDLQKIKGVKEAMEKMLHDIGVYYYWQIAEWSEQDIHHADAQLPQFHGRIQRDEWVSQAARLMREPDASPRPDAPTPDAPAGDRRGPV